MMGAWIFQFPDICTASSDIAGTHQDLIVFCYYGSYLLTDFFFAVISHVYFPDHAQGYCYGCH